MLRPEAPAGPTPGTLPIGETLAALIQMALTDGSLELRRAEHETGQLRLNLSLTVRHGRVQGSTSSLVFEKRLGH
jgi:hypothetical protein